MSLPLVSVIIPSYNNETRIEFALKSVIAQDYENLEIIFVNDASKDNTLDIAEKILKNSKRIFKIINHEKNLGVSVARNDGIDASNGDFICFCDGDDMMKENQVSSLYSLFQKYDCGISFCGMIEHFESGEPDKLSPIKFNISQPLKGEQAAYMTIFTKGFIPHLCAMMFRKNFLEKISLRFVDGVVRGQDIEFSRKALCRADKVAFTPECLYIYVHHGNMGAVRDNDTKEKKIRNFESVMGVNIRTSEYILQYAKSQKTKFFIKNSYLPELAIKRFTACAIFNKPEEYSKLLKDTKLRKNLWRSLKTFFFKPEICLKAIAILFMPRLYYKLRKK